MGLRPATVTIDVEADIASAKTKSAAADTTRRARSTGDEPGAIANQLQFKRDGEWLHASLAINNAQLPAATDKLPPMMGR